VSLTLSKLGGVSRTICVGSGAFLGDGVGVVCGDPFCILGVISGVTGIWAADSF